MKRRKQEGITTYISTLTVNFGNNNQSTKSKPHSKSNNTPSKHQLYRSSTTYLATKAPQPYRQAQQNSSGTYYQLTTSNSANRKEPEQKNEQKSPAFHRSKAYFEGLSTSSSSADGSWSTKRHNSRDTVRDVQQYKDNPSMNDFNPKIEKCYEKTVTKPSLKTSHTEKTYESEFKPEAPTPVSSIKDLDFPKPKSASRDISFGVTKTSTGKSASKEITTTTTTTTSTTIEEKRTLTSVKSSEVTSVKPATDYGETDWYLDVLLRMQALEMKQQNLHAEYDFLGKLAKQNREDLKLSKDWARYNADNYGVQAY